MTWRFKYFELPCCDVESFGKCCTTLWRNPTPSSSRFFIDLEALKKKSTRFPETAGTSQPFRSRYIPEYRILQYHSWDHLNREELSLLVGMKWLLDTRTAKGGHCFIESPLERLIQRTNWCCYRNFSLILRKCCGDETRNVADLPAASKCRWTE